MKNYYLLIPLLCLFQIGLFGQQSVYRSTIKNRRGWNQYTGTKSHMNKMISAANVSSLFNYTAGAFNASIHTYRWRTGQINNFAYGIEMFSTGVSTFARNSIGIIWTAGYEGLGRQGITRFDWYQNRLKPWVRRTFF